MGQTSDPTTRLHSTLMELLAKECIPWRRPWREKGMAHLNLFSGQPYGGADPLLLDVAMVNRGVALPWWCTYVEAREGGLTPRKGAVGVALGVARPPGARRKRLEVVFNVADLVGRPLQQLMARRRQSLWGNSANQVQRLQKAEQLLRAWPVSVREGTHLPRYHQREDQILLPMRHNFHCREAFLATWAREQIRSTGHPERLAQRVGALATDCWGGREEFVLELAWILQADRLGVGREYGLFVLAEADWIEMLQPSPQALINLITESCWVADLLAPARGM